MACTACIWKNHDCDARRPRCGRCRRLHIRCKYEAPPATAEIYDETANVKARYNQPKRRRFQTPEESSLAHLESSATPGDSVPSADLSLPWLSEQAGGWSWDRDLTAEDFDWMSGLFASGPSEVQDSNSPYLGSFVTHSLIDDSITTDLVNRQPQQHSTDSLPEYVLSQHYHDTLAKQYSAKTRAWNWWTFLYHRFHRSHPSVRYGLLSWSATHLYLCEKLDCTSEALRYYERCVDEISLAAPCLRDWVNGETSAVSSTEIWKDVTSTDAEAICSSLYFLACTNLLLNRAQKLRNVLAATTSLLESFLPNASLLLLKVSSWFRFLEARSSAFGGRPSGLMAVLGGEKGVSQAILTTTELLASEYKTVYPQAQLMRDRALAPVQETHHRLLAIFGEISDADSEDCHRQERLRNSLDSIAAVSMSPTHQRLEADAAQRLLALDERSASAQNIQIPYLTAKAMYHATEIHLSRVMEPNTTLYRADTHAAAIIQITSSISKLLRTAASDPPPSKNWPLPLFLAAIEAKDPIYRDWAIRRLKDYGHGYGLHYPLTAEFAARVQQEEETAGRRLCLKTLREKFGEDFVV